MLARLKPNPSIIFISETRIHDSTLQKQLSEITIEGYHDPVYDNSSSNAGGTAIYVSKNLEFKKHPDIKYNHEDCEACFIEIECKSPKHNPIFGVLYRHPVQNVRSFTNYLSEFLETFTTRGVMLTLMGDINIDLNKSNIVSNDYINTLNALGFTALINQPTRIYSFEGATSVSCSTLDHLITNCSSSFDKVGILISDVSIQFNFIEF